MPLEVVPVSPAVDPPGLPFAFDISVGVKKGEKQLKDEIDGVLARHRREIGKILDDYGVPRVPAAEAPSAAAR